MIHPAIPSLLLVLAAPVAVAADPAPPTRGVEFGQVTIHERIIIRLPRMATASAPAALPVPIVWKEKKGPTCIAANELGGAIFGQPGYVDLVMTGNRRFRARFDGHCGPLDFYSGVYIRPGSDGKICADRDAIKTRSGATCEIDKFRTLVAKH